MLACAASRFAFIFRPFSVLVNTDGDVADDHVVDTHAAFELGYLLTAAVDLEKHIIPSVFFLIG